MAFSPKMDSQVKNHIASILNIKTPDLKEKYLGVPILIQRNKMETFSHLPDRFLDRLASWKGKNMNQPTRTVMVQSVLGTLTSHHLVVFPMPKKTYRQNEMEFRGTVGGTKIMVLKVCLLRNESL